MSKRHYRAVVVGCGRIGALYEKEPHRAKPASHAGAIAHNPRTELAALVDVDRKQLDAAAKLFPRAARFTSVEKCLAEIKPDILVIATPPAQRERIVARAIRAGVPLIICEKPLARTVREAKRIERMARDSSVSFVANYQRRFSPLYAAVREDIRRGAIGRVQHAACIYGNGILNNGGHLIDALLFLLGEPITSASGLFAADNAAHPEGDRNIDGILRTKSGVRISLQHIDQRAFAMHDMCIYGTRGSITITDYGARALWHRTRPSSFARLRMLDARPARTLRMPLSATKGVLDAALDILEGARRNTDGVRQGITVMKVVEALKRSAHGQGRLEKI